MKRLEMERQGAVNIRGFTWCGMFETFGLRETQKSRCGLNQDTIS